MNQEAPFDLGWPACLFVRTFLDGVELDRRQVIRVDEVGRRVKLETGLQLPGALAPLSRWQSGLIEVRPLPINRLLREAWMWKRRLTPRGFVR